MKVVGVRFTSRQTLSAVNMWMNTSKESLFSVQYMPLSVLIVLRWISGIISRLG